jgi:hypothetical protein
MTCTDALVSDTVVLCVLLLLLPRALRSMSTSTARATTAGAFPARVRKKPPRLWVSQQRAARSAGETCASAATTSWSSSAVASWLPHWPTGTHTTAAIAFLAKSPFHVQSQIVKRKQTAKASYGHTQSERPGLVRSLK